MPQISVIVPVYNVEDFLAKCLDSIVTQSFQDFEVIVVDDGSTDNSAKIAKEFEDKYNNVFVILQENGGPGAARNTGIEAAKGQYFLFVDSDDHIHKDTLKLLYEKVQQTNADIVIFDMAVEDMNGNIIKTDKGCEYSKEPMTIENCPELLTYQPSVWNKIYHRDIFVKSGLRMPNRVWYEDLRIIPKILSIANQIEYVNVPLYYYLQRPGSIMNSTNVERNKDILEALDDIINYFKEKDIFKTYYSELEYLAVLHVFILASIRVLKIDRKNSLLEEFRNYIKKNFPNYMDNSYVAHLSKKEKLIIKLLSSKKYFALSILFKLKNG